MDQSSLPPIHQVITFIRTLDTLTAFLVLCRGVSIYKTNVACSLQQRPSEQCLTFLDYTLRETHNLALYYWTWHGLVKKLSPYV